MIFNNNNNNNNNLLSPHVFPVNPGTQEQVKLLIPSLHVPPFLHGPLAHSSISKEFNNTTYFCSRNVLNLYLKVTK